MLQDLRYAVRTLRRMPLITLTAVITLALGIGASTAVFSVVDAVVLRPLPFHEPDRLVRIWELTRDGDRFSWSEPDYLDLQAMSATLQHVAAYSDLGETTVLAGAGEPERILAVPVTASLPGVLGVAPVLGRTFTADEARAQAERPVILSDALWRRRFGGDLGVLERRIALDGVPAYVTGVMPPAFDFPGDADAWIPLAPDPVSDRGDHELGVIGRLAPGASEAQLAGELRTFMRRLAEQYPAIHAGWSAEAVPFDEWIVTPRTRAAVWALFGAVGVLLLLACANVASLLLAQGAARRAEMRIRTALGASRGRLVRQFLTESALLAILGTAVAVYVAIWSIDAVRALGADRVPRVDELRVNLAVFAFAGLAGIASCLLFGLAPAIYAARTDLRAGMDEGLRYTAGNRRLRHGLVIVEVTLAVVLLVGAALIGNSFVRLVRVDPGFDTRDTIAMPLQPPSAPDAGDRVATFYGEVLDRVRALPGVAAAGATSTNPFRQFGFSNDVTPTDRAADAPPSGLVQAGWRSVTPGYFEAMRIPILSGRTFDAADGRERERVAIVSERLARRLWPEGPIVGKQIFWGGTTGRPWTVIGVVGDIRDLRLDAEPAPMLFVPHRQVTVPAMTIVARTSLGLADVAPAMRDAVREIDPSLPAPAVDRIDASGSHAVAGTRFNLSLLGAFALIAIVLAATGVYAMLAFTVSERRREIAVRLALGATPPAVTRLVMRTGLGLALTGVLAGILAALAATRVLARLLFGVEPTDPATLAAAGLGLLAIAACASWLPARDAARVNPIAVLRE